VRCWLFTLEKSRDFKNDTTPRPKTEKEVWSFATDKRLRKYMEAGTSTSMMDHYFDKLLHIVETDTNVTKNTYLTSKAKKEVAPLVTVCLEYGKSGKVPLDLIKGYAKEFGLEY